MPTYRISVRETRTYEIEAATETEARTIIDRDEAELPIGSLRSVDREEVSVRPNEEAPSTTPGETPGDWPPLEGEPRPEMPTPRAF